MGGPHKWQYARELLSNAPVKDDPFSSKGFGVI
jgi:hypothetical protein